MYTLLFVAFFSGFIGAFAPNQHRLIPAMAGTAFFRSYPETASAVSFFERLDSPEMTLPPNQGKTSVAIPGSTTVSSEGRPTPKLESSEGSQSLEAAIGAGPEGLFGLPWNHTTTAAWIRIC